MKLILPVAKTIRIKTEIMIYLTEKIPYSYENYPDSF